MPWVERIATLENTLAEVKTGRLGDTLGNLQAEALVKTLAYTLVVVKFNTLCDTRDDVQAEALVKTLADTLPEVKAETVAMWRPRHCSTRWLTPQKKVYDKTLAHTLCDVAGNTRGMRSP